MRKDDAMHLVTVQLGLDSPARIGLPIWRRNGQLSLLQINGFCRCIRVLVERHVELLEFVGGRPELLTQLLEMDIEHCLGLSPHFGVALCDVFVPASEPKTYVIQGLLNCLGCRLCFQYDTVAFEPILGFTVQTLG